MISDESLYYNYIDGDSNALAELLARYDESLNLFIFSFVKNEEEAEDLAIDAFAHLAASDKRFKGKSSFKTWLFAIGRNLALEYLRRHRIDMDDLFDECAADFKTPDLPILQKERYAQLYRALGMLNAEYRQVLYLKFFEDMSVAETAKVTGKKERQISDLIYRGKQALKKELEKAGFEYENY